MELARGVKDYPPEVEVVRQELFSLVVDAFERFGFSAFSSSVIQRKETLTFKFAGDEDVMSELFSLSDQGGRELGLRFDLTVPLCRFVAENKDLKLPFKRFEIGRVYRDGPIKAGRTREFWQCDADIVGSSSMVADAECLQLLDFVFSELPFEYEIRVNNRKLLDEVLSSLGISEKQKTITLLDKIRKIGEEELRKQYLEYLSEEQVSGLFSFIKKDLDSFDDSVAVRELREVFSLVNSENVVFDPSLARGLNYYTGTVFEVFLKDSVVTSSVAAGGRYDNIIGQMRGGEVLPAVGCSFGVEPLTEALLAVQFDQGVSFADIFVAPIGVVQEAFVFAQTLRKIGYRVDLDVMGRSISKNLDYADKQNISFVLVVGKRDLDEGVVTLKNMRTGEEEKLSVGELEELDLELFE
ncbi:MAG: histidine--tRNA ligase [Candidatus Woesearchaeota archaeon]